MVRIVRVEGLRELDRALRELPKATGKNVLRRVLRKRAEPLRADAEARAPRDTGHLAASAGIGTKLSRRQAQLQKEADGGGPRMTSEGWRSAKKHGVTMYVGFPSTPKSIVQEFGNSDQPAQPFMRPAWDANKNGILDGLAQDLGDEIKRAADRLAKKAARASGG